MKYQLKDLLLQLKLDFLSNGDFSKHLDATIKDFLTVHQFEKIPKSFCVNFGEDLAKGRGEFGHSPRPFAKSSPKFTQNDFGIFSNW